LRGVARVLTGLAQKLAEVRRDARTTIPSAVVDLCRFWREREDGSEAGLKLILLAKSFQGDKRNLYSALWLCLSGQKSCFRPVLRHAVSSFPAKVLVRRIRQQYPSVYEAIKPLNGVKPLACLTNVLERMVSGRTKAHELERLLPWAWKAERLPAVGHT
jgi:hypothetical protein